MALRLLTADAAQPGGTQLASDSWRTWLSNAGALTVRVSLRVCSYRAAASLASDGIADGGAPGDDAGGDAGNCCGGSGSATAELPAVLVRAQLGMPRISKAPLGKLLQLATAENLDLGPKARSGKVAGGVMSLR
mmetsp:Transcript_11491/g.21716  ORF Transcript_11491/g.21716 Transcript_11491/m.21716 type:complete len:134 (+) Transcript_11491:2447-2848(+)